MDNPDNLNTPLKPVSDFGMYSPNKSSKNNNQLLYSQSPFPSKVSLYNTPSKLCEGRMLYPSLIDTPINFNLNNLNMNFPISPLNNEQKGDFPFQNLLNGQKNESSAFKVLESPTINDKK